MGNEHGEWIMYGLPNDDPRRLRSFQDLLEHIDAVGFLPLFKNSLPGFSVEEITGPGVWWSGDEERDPWIWRERAARSGKVAYGKFFDRKAGFISLDWLPVFANARRDGYDFDALWEDGLAHHRTKRIMDLFEQGEEYYSFELKRLAGFGKGGEKNFEGVVTALQMQTYLVIRDFRSRRNRAGEPYGWHIAVYTKPETIWGYEAVTSSYSKDPSLSRERIMENMGARFPNACQKELLRALGGI